MDNNITVNMENLSADEREQLMNLIEKANKVENEAWKPKCEEEYYFINNDGLVIRGTWYNTLLDKKRYEIGNCFRTQEEAEFAVEKLKVVAEMKQIAAKDESVEWGKPNFHYFMYYHHNDNKIEIDGVMTTNYGITYFASEKRVQEAIDTIGEDRIKKYLFGIEV